MPRLSNLCTKWSYKSSSKLSVDEIHFLKSQFKEIFTRYTKPHWFHWNLSFWIGKFFPRTVIEDVNLVCLIYPKFFQTKLTQLSFFNKSPGSNDEVKDRFVITWCFSCVYILWDKEGLLSICKLTELSWLLKARRQCGCLLVFDNFTNVFMPFELWSEGSNILEKWLVGKGNVSN